MKILALALTVVLLSAGRARAQVPVQTQFALQRGWLYFSPPAQRLVLDTVAAPGRQNIPTTYTTLDGYRLALQGSGRFLWWGPTIQPGSTMPTAAKTEAGPCSCWRMPTVGCCSWLLPTAT
ncbi:hypothetical protein [Hymenobacter cellulosilyticus]|uniref:Uncharacterized protein n=1 Tax=Hymenobacter cellulosilyticus TaxID=2932248 RepID=A0A8T9Q3S5_9BACT|nr:hypothetical protein [Hymenobacter cellulosilyticus]UOQ71091.1 hypothetical protein MUN79_20820 [Hymenobacter cellulosilyticus]